MKKDVKKDYRTWAKTHPNFMTPHTLAVRKRDESTIVAIEEGSGMNQGEKLYGVTIAKRQQGKNKFKTIEGGKAFTNKKEAYDYADKVQKNPKVEYERQGAYKVYGTGHGALIVGADNYDQAVERYNTEVSRPNPQAKASKSKQNAKQNLKRIS